MVQGSTPQGRRPRRAWSRPRLTLHGSLAQLTEKNHGHGKMAGAFDGLNMMPPGLAS